MQNKILRPMVKKLAQLDLLFLSYGQITANFDHFLIMAKFSWLEGLAVTFLITENNERGDKRIIEGK